MGFLLYLSCIAFIDRMLFFFFFRTELLDELGSLSFSIFDGASVSEWKGKDLRLADNIPNIDLLVLSIEQV